MSLFALVSYWRAIESGPFKKSVYKAILSENNTSQMTQVAANKRHSTSNTIFCLPKPKNLQIEIFDSLRKNHVKSCRKCVHFCWWPLLPLERCGTLCLCSTGIVCDFSY